MTTPKRAILEVPLLSPNKKRKLYSQDPNSFPKNGSNVVVELVNTIDQYLESHQNMLKVYDLHQLILWILQCNVAAPKWIQVRHKHAVRQVVLIQVDGLTKDNATPLPVFQNIFTTKHCYPLRIETSIFSVNGVSENYLKVDMNKILKKKADSSYRGRSWSLENFLLSKAEMRANLYPKEDQPEYKDFLNTKDWSEAKVPHDLLAIDCEMVQTSQGLELCQCSVVDVEGNTLMNHHVKPRREIICYYTKWSGVSAETLNGVTRRVEDIQDELRRWITNKTILVGHSLENDLKALQIIHHRVIDTAILFPHQIGRRKYSLKYLAKRYLKRNIQKGDGTSGHNPVEDAIAALELMILKVKNGPSFGVQLTGNHSIINILRQQQKTTHVFGSRVVTDRASCNPANITTLLVNDPELVAKISKACNNPNVDLVWLQLMRGFMKVSNEDNSVRVNETISSIWKKILPQTLMIIHTGRRRLKRLKDLQQRNILARVRKGSPLTNAERAELKTLERDVTHHHFWVAVKNEGSV